MRTSHLFPLTLYGSQFQGGEECGNTESKWLLLSVLAHLKLSSQLVKSQNAFLKEGNKIGEPFSSCVQRLCNWLSGGPRPLKAKPI